MGADCRVEDHVVEIRESADRVEEQLRTVFAANSNNRIPLLLAVLDRHLRIDLFGTHLPVTALEVSVFMHELMQSPLDLNRTDEARWRKPEAPALAGAVVGGDHVLELVFELFDGTVAGVF